MFPYLTAGIDMFPYVTAAFNTDLRAARAKPVKFTLPERLVYVAHDYGVDQYDEHGECNCAQFSAALDRRWGWLLQVRHWR